MVVSCQEKPTPEPAEKPVVTADMYSVTVNSETGDVTFKFVAADLDPYWTVVDPNGAKESFYDREITKKYEVPGLYTGSIVAFGEGGIRRALPRILEAGPVACHQHAGPQGQRAPLPAHLRGQRNARLCIFTDRGP